VRSAHRSLTLWSTETLTFLFTDIEGSTALLRRLGESTYAEVLADQRQVIRAGLATHDGKEVDTQGDGFFAVFSSARACAAAVVEMQRAFEAHQWPAQEHVRVRMGVHVGEASETATGLVGLDVHCAARVAAVGHGGQILFSEALTALVRDRLPAGVSLRDLGLHRLKDLGHPQHIFQVQAGGLTPDFPPLRSLDNPALANNLPVQLARFIGRDCELSEIRRLVQSSRLVTLTGAGGSGKTRLALQVAAELLDGSGDGVWLVELAPVPSGDSVPETIAHALGITNQSARPALDTLVDALLHQRLLIILDNCEHLIGSCAKVADTILRRCPGAHLIATSREPLGIGGETIYRVPSMSLPAPGEDRAPGLRGSDAAALFVERARTQGVGLAADKETADLVASTCRRLDGMPLAIELAAARLRSLSLRDLHDLLDQRFRLLTGGSRSAMERQQTLRATVDWSYSLLNGAERSLLRRLSVFSDGFDLRAAGAVCAFGDIEAFEVTDILGSLVDKSLVVTEATDGSLRYRLLETIRQFAAERLVETGPDEAAAVAAAHCEHFLALAERAARDGAGADQGWWFARLRADHSNLRRAIEHAAADPAKTAVVLRFAVALEFYWWATSRRQEAFALLRPVLDRPEALAVPDVLCGALVTGALMARFVDVKKSELLAERAVEVARELGDEPLFVRALGMMGSACAFGGDYERGLRFGLEAVERARVLGDDLLLARSINGYVLCLYHLDPSRTEELYAEAIVCLERTGNLYYTEVVQNNAGCGALAAGDVAGARAHFEASLSAMQALGLSFHHAFDGLGWVRRQEGDRDGAGTLFEEALRMSRKAGDTPCAASACLGLACVAGDIGDWQRASVLHGVAQSMLDTTGEPWDAAEGTYSKDSTERARVQLGDDEFNRGFSKGRHLRVEEAVDLALGRTEPA
jgi:predicted ATPase/class 3 adenylate cyclase